MMVIVTVIFSAFFVLAPFQKNVPEPISTHTGLVAGAYSYSAGLAPLGSIHLEILDQVNALHAEDPELFFWPNNLGRHLSPETIESQELTASPHPAMQLFYVAAFTGFGESLSSVIVLWAILFALGIGVGLLIPLSRRALQALGLVLGFLVITVTSLPLLDSQSLSVVNYRVLPLLIVFPVSTLVLLFADRRIISARTLFAVLIMAIMIGFVIAGRASAIWAIIAILAAGVFNVWGLRGRSFFRPATQAVILVATIFGSSLIFSFSPLAGLGDSPRGPALDKKIASIDESVNPATTMRWFSVNLGLFTDPRLHEKYVCNVGSAEVFTGVDPIPCSGKSVTMTQALITAVNPKNNYSDLAGYNSVIRYIGERDLDRDLELPPARIYGDLTQFPMNWPVLGEVSREIAFEMIRQDPGIVLQNLIFVKPVRLFFVLAKQPVLALTNVSQASSSPLLLIPLALVSGIFVFVTRDVLREKNQAHNPNGQVGQYRATMWALFILATSSSLVAIAFYAQSHTVLDIGVLTVSFLSFLAIHSALRRWQRARPSFLSHKPQT